MRIFIGGGVLFAFIILILIMAIQFIPQVIPAALAETKPGTPEADQGQPQTLQSISRAFSVLENRLTVLKNLLAETGSGTEPARAEHAKNGGRSFFYRDLTAGDRGSDVTILQRFLDDHGSPVATQGLGSIGDETEFFGTETTAALAKWQESNGIAPTGCFGPLTRAYIENEMNNDST